MEPDSASEFMKLVDHMAASVRFADAGTVLRYANARDMQREDIRDRLGRSIEDCHGVSLPEFRRLYGEWEAGSSQVQVYIHRDDPGPGARFDIMIPVHDSTGFRGVVEILFNAEPQSR